MPRNFRIIEYVTESHKTGQLPVFRRSSTKMILDVTSRNKFFVV